MKLLIYSHYFAPSIGGVEVIVESLAGGLAALRTPEGAPQFDVTLVTQTPAGAFDDRSLPFAVVRRPGLLRLRQHVRDSDVVHIAGPAFAPMILSRLARKPYVIEHHGYQAICLNGQLLLEPRRSVCPGHFQAARYLRCLRCRAIETSWPRSLLDLLAMFPRYWLAGKARANLAISSHVLGRLRLPRTSVAYYGIEDLLGHGAAGSLAAKDSRQKMTFAYVGRFTPEKGIPVLLDAARLLRAGGESFDLLLIGDGPQRARLEALLEDYGLRSHVRLTGFLSGQALVQALADVNAVVMPSVVEETAGLAAIEQMMRGRLVIAADIGGLGEVVADTGLKFPAGDAQALASCMLAVLRDPSLVDALGAKARARALRLFTRERMIAGHAAVYSSLRS